MSSTTDKIKGVTNEVIGKTKQAAGSALENDKLRLKAWFKKPRAIRRKRSAKPKTR
ncbi:hypothetical protein [Elstera litoralis]|uniref:hypothetical protein n=1 Tax=Elstera litoralis TaxID=552518 RepID=UPI001E2B36E1|nr:hypothetical protein [Elstera litoralis]